MATRMCIERKKKCEQCGLGRREERRNTRKIAWIIRSRSRIYLAQFNRVWSQVKRTYILGEVALGLSNLEIA